MPYIPLKVYFRPPEIAKLALLRPKIATVAPFCQKPPNWRFSLKNRQISQEIVKFGKIFAKNRQIGAFSLKNRHSGAFSSKNSNLPPLWSSQVKSSLIENYVFILNLKDFCDLL